MTSVEHPIFARAWGRISARLEPELGKHRRRLLAGLHGAVLEIGAGNGLNFAHYPAEVTRVLAVEPEPHLRDLAREAAKTAGIQIEVVDGLADRLPAEDASMDAAVTTLVLCSVPDQASALAEIRRVLRRDGQLRFLEHVRADSRLMAGTQRLLDATIWPFLAGGCHTHRDTQAAIVDAGFTFTDLNRVRFPDVRISTPTSTSILGTAQHS